ncbi:SGNH/GDSL hydrolase family protein [Paenibacillus chartarius]|uniref:SGNH/GDSL hydrolase family protein n=1 Tax=Paenibacillus chartarius TaxID=747481 RepID=A0ABV6DE31_9BACL
MSQKEQPVRFLQLDPNMRIVEGSESPAAWYRPTEEPFHVAGFAWLRQDGRYRRLPTAPAWPVPAAVDALANCTAGGQIRFRTDSASLSVKVKLAGAADMYHMPATGQCGFDCYIGDFGEQRYLSTTRYDHRLKMYESVLFEKLDRQMRTVTLNFPLYQAVEEVLIGLDKDAQAAPPPAYDTDRKVIFYGTSITQGGCASRPGLAYPNILSRRFNREFLNFGFAGNGKGEPELARIIAEIPDPECLILDYEANCVSTELLQQTLPAFIAIYRERHPDTPILVISRITYAKDRFHAEMARHKAERKQVQLRAVEQRREQGDNNIYFFDGSDLLGESADECTVDGVHPTDLGFMRMADGLTPVLKRMLNG